MHDEATHLGQQTHSRVEPVRLERELGDGHAHAVAVDDCGRGGLHLRDENVGGIADLCCLRVERRDLGGGPELRSAFDHHVAAGHDVIAAIVELQHV